jgi:hypothetical protein
MAQRRGTGSSSGSSSTSLAKPRIVVVHGPITARRSQGPRLHRPRHRRKDVARRPPFGTEGFELLADANQEWSLDDAVSIAPDLHDCDVAWMEEPVAGAPASGASRLYSAGNVVSADPERTKKTLGGTLEGDLRPGGDVVGVRASGSAHAPTSS